MLRHAPTPPPFPYTTLFRSEHQMALELRPAHDPTRAYGFLGVVVSLKDLSAKLPRQENRRRGWGRRSEEHTSELQSRFELVCRLLREKKKKDRTPHARFALL